MFNKGLNNIEELERLEALEYITNIELVAASSSTTDEFLSSDLFSTEAYK